MRFFGLSTVVAAAFLLTACGGRPAAGSDPVSTVEAVYAPYVAHAANPPALDNAAPWTADLAALIEAAEGVEGGLGFDPIIDGQDYEVAGLQIAAADGAAAGQAVVDARFTNLGDEVTVTYDLVQENGGWRVQDVRTEDWTLRGALASIGVTPESIDAAESQ
jgi:hypothetical protein